MIATRQGRRWLNAAGVGIVIALMGYALYAQYIQGLEACPLCMLQRMALIFGVAPVFAVAALHAPRGAGARVYTILNVLAALIGMRISS